MRKILFILSEYGYWGEELVGPLETLRNKGFSIDFATPTGKKPHALLASIDTEFIYPPLGKSVVSEEMAKKVEKIEQSSILDEPIDISQLMENRPYMSQKMFLREFEEYNKSIEEASKTFEDYDALFLVGGTGALIDMVNNQRVHNIILDFYYKNKPIAADGYGVACLAFAREYWNRKSIIKGKRVTGHPLEYDYLDGTSFWGTDFNMGPPTFPLEFVLRDATGDKGQFIGNMGKEISVIVDYPFITGRSIADAYKTGEMLSEVLEKGTKKYGW